MRSWRETSVGEICTLRNGRAYHKNELLDHGKYTVLRVGNFFSNRSWYFSDLELAEDKYCSHGDLLYAWSASFGPRIWDGEKVIYHYHIWKVDIDQAQVDKRFLYHWFNWDVDRIRSEQGTGATMIHVTKGAMEARSLRLPPLSEQKRIAGILDQADGLRRKRQQALALTDQFLRSTFLDLFGDPVTNPKQWPETTLGEVIYAANDGPHVSPEYAESGIPFLSTRHVRSGSVEWKDLKYITEQEAERQWKKCKPERGDVLYSKGGTTGVAAVVDFDTPIAVWVHVALLKPNFTRVDPVWLAAMLNTPYCYAQSQRFTRGATNKDLGLTRMVKIQMPLPPLDAQLRFVRAYHKVADVKCQNRASTEAAESLFNSLVQRAFRGEL